MLLRMNINHSKSDPILSSDFRKLMKAIGSTEPDSTAHCEKIINHLIAEVSETTEDDQRMDDEGPVCEKNNPISCQHLQEHLNLKRDLETYRVTYLTDNHRSEP